MRNMKSKREHLSGLFLSYHRIMSVFITKSPTVRTYRRMFQNSTVAWDCSHLIGDDCCLKSWILKYYSEVFHHPSDLLGTFSAPLGSFVPFLWLPSLFSEWLPLWLVRRQFFAVVPELFSFLLEDHCLAWLLILWLTKTRNTLLMTSRWDLDRRDDLAENNYNSRKFESENELNPARQGQNITNP